MFALEKKTFSQNGATRQTQIGDLPIELVEKILLDIPPAERLHAALAGNLLAGFVDSHRLLRDVWISIWRHKQDDDLEIAMQSQRSYPNLRLMNVFLSGNEFGLWEKFGPELRNLELVQCEWHPSAFYRMLRKCTKLETLKITPPIPEDYEYSDYKRSVELPEDVRLEEIQEALKHVRHVHLVFPPDAELLRPFLDLVPNAAITLPQISSDPDFLELLREVSARGQKIEAVLLKGGGVKRDLMEVVRLSHENLRKLRFYSWEPSMAELYSLIGVCRELRELRLTGADRLSDGHLAKIIENAPALGSLELDDCKDLSVKGLLRIHRLKKLRKLRLRNCPNATDEFLSTLGGIGTLRHLDLRSRPTSADVLETFASLGDLRSLSLGPVDSAGLDVICQIFRKLKTLKLENCETLSEADMPKFAALKALEKLHFQDGCGFTNLAVEGGFGCPALEALELSRCGLNDEGLAAIAANHSGLKKLKLRFCEDVTKAGLEALLRAEPLIEHLELSFDTTWNKFSRRFFARLGSTTCPRLRILRIGGNDLNLDDSFIDGFLLHKKWVTLR